ncbi:MAG: hypothetical protein PWP03_768 [Candidatus Woesearchaeota archaeon]|nr:hypothetical protein [Candidatus Woesearchaeota archaeon]MDN5328130.1 hypothetical protein [Candidatus Woesearchaeota archaeon]
MKTYYIIFDKNGEIFFLIGKKEDWCLFYSEDDSLPLSTPVLREVQTLNYNDIKIKVFESNMNLPVTVSSQYKSYLWATKQSVLSKLTGEDLEVFKYVLDNLN